MDWTSISLSTAALVISVVSYWFSRKSWMESNRPIVTASVRTVSTGNLATALQLVVVNSGNRPAQQVQLSVTKQDLASALVPDADPTYLEGIQRCFSPDGMIPVLLNGASEQNAFGVISPGPDACWRDNALLSIGVQYTDMGTQRRFRHRIILRIAENTAFARSNWADSRAR